MFIVQSEEEKGIRIGGPTVPVIILACNNCGYIVLHAKGVLMREEEDKNG